LQLKTEVRIELDRQKLDWFKDRPMGSSSLNGNARRIILILAVTAVALLAVFFVFEHLYGWLPALVATALIVFILLIAIAVTTPVSFATLFIALIAIYLLVAFFVFAHYFGWLAALKGIGTVTLILVTAGWVISRIR
jgi:hypothetical protein